MDRILVVPAAGRGSRLAADVPKALAPVAGRPMVDHILDLHRDFVDAFVLVVSPGARAAFVSHLAGRPEQIDLAVQQHPTGMLDAILAAGDHVATRRPRRVCVTWCDQIAISPATIARLRDAAAAENAPALVFPTLHVAEPYIHFDRDGAGRISAVRQRREGDAMPAAGETDIGLFDLSLDTFLVALPEFAQSAATTGTGTGERNFLPFIPWLAARARVETVAAGEVIESVGINTPDDRRRVESHVRERTR